MRPKSNRGRRGQAKIEEKFAINEAITAPQVRLVGEGGEQLGVVLIKDALARAEANGMDLVAVAPDADPPVCRILDYGKLKYKEQKKAAESRKRSATNTVKEIRIRYSTDSHDLETKVRMAKKFIGGGDKVRFQMQFRGREVVYRDLGEDIFKQLTEVLSDVAVVEERSPLMGKRMTITFAPKVTS
ncbi:UNVERIFIED_CONTAM: hypothetical protein GTU68_028106 [Idotea baltica]|nr:hypothetical protein [Idotea baltica]